MATEFNYSGPAGALPIYVGAGQDTEMQRLFKGLLCCWNKSPKDRTAIPEQYRLELLGQLVRNCGYHSFAQGVCEIVGELQTAGAKEDALKVVTAALLIGKVEVPTAPAVPATKPQELPQNADVLSDVRCVSCNKYISQRRLEAIPDTRLCIACARAAETEEKERSSQVAAIEAQIKAGLRCPTCHGRLVIKRGKNGHFKGCENFPKCEYTATVFWQNKSQ